MTPEQTILETWLLGKKASERQSILQKASDAMVQSNDVPLQGLIEQIAAGLVSQCAEDLGLTPMELQQLLKTPRKDALKSLVTVVECGE
tara:strand:+ start:114 stop:380 length:267 start_codon:yes stop_codon:yes gene_type:complete